MSALWLIAAAGWLFIVVVLAFIHDEIRLIRKAVESWGRE